MTNYVNCKNSEGSGNYRKFLKSEWKNILLIFMGFTENNKGTRKCLYVSDLSFKATADHHKEHRYEEDCQQRCRDHSAHYPDTHCVLRAPAGTVTDS
ncbi:hypothetical protein BvCmsKSP064_03229 [Escherichia coli]|nr:hypothetical protein BvCmsKSP064_03229 [Escherichia coli]